MDTNDDLTARKMALRKLALSNRAAQADKDELSRRIGSTLHALPEYHAARTVLYYLDVRNEVRTRHLFPRAFADDKRIAVPYCVADELGLFHLQGMDELAAGTFGILEPKPGLRDLPSKHVEVREVDLIVVPGVAFDRRGRRLGHGFGYYDKLLRQARPDACLVGLAFECQVFDEVPIARHDVYLDRVVSETACYSGRGRVLIFPSFLSERGSGERDGEGA